MQFLLRITMLLDLIEAAGDLVKRFREWNKQRRTKGKRK
jgi:hypothetical protein